MDKEKIENIEKAILWLMDTTDIKNLEDYDLNTNHFLVTIMHEDILKDFGGLDVTKEEVVDYCKKKLAVAETKRRILET